MLLLLWRVALTLKVPAARSGRWKSDDGVREREEEEPRGAARRRWKRQPARSRRAKRDRSRSTHGWRSRAGFLSAGFPWTAMLSSFRTTDATVPRRPDAYATTPCPLFFIPSDWSRRDIEKARRPAPRRRRPRRRRRDTRARGPADVDGLNERDRKRASGNRCEPDIVEILGTGRGTPGAPRRRDAPEIERWRPLTKRLFELDDVLRGPLTPSSDGTEAVAQPRAIFHL